MRITVFLFVLFFTSTAFAQNELNALRLYLGASGSSCVLRSGTGVPSTSLGSVCDVYVRKDSPYTVYQKTGASTWSEVYRQAGTDVAVADGGTGLSSYTTGDILYASSPGVLAGRAAVATGQVLASAGTSTAPAYTASPSLTSIGGAANLTLNPSGDVVLAPTGLDILPDSGYSKNLGSLSNKYLTLHAAELWVETLVAQNTIATIGGRVLVGPTTVLTSDLSSGATSIVVKHNQMSSGDRVYLEANGSVEFLAITSTYSGSGPYTYTVTRNLDGTGANAWIAGDAVFNTGQTGSGFMDIYSYGGVTPAGLSHIYNNDGSSFSANYFETSTVTILGDSANDAVDDAIYFGAQSAWYALSSFVLAPLTLGTGTVAIEFWNGGAWTALTGTGGPGFASLGPGNLTWANPQTGWVTTTVNGVSAYWVRFRVTSVGSGITPGSWRLITRQANQWGPTIVGNVRASSTFNDWSPRWAIGNLNGLYGYGTTTYGAAFGNPAASWVKLDDTNGLRMGNAGTTTMQITPAGAASFVSGNVSIDATVGITLATPSVLTPNRAYQFTVATGSIGLFGSDGSGNRVASVYTDWTAAGNIGGGVYAVLQAFHNPSGGTVKNTQIEALANSSQSKLTMTAESIVFGNDFTIFTTNATSTSIPYIRSDGNALVIESRSDANAGGIFLGNDQNTSISLGAGGGTTDINIATVQTLTFDTDTTVTTGGIAQTAADGLTFKGVSGSVRDATFYSSGGNIVWAGTSTGEMAIGGVASDGTGKVVCVLSTGALGTCNATTIGTSTCTCA